MFRVRQKLTHPASMISLQTNKEIRKMVASRKNTRRNDPFEAIVETWIARLLLRDNL